MTLTGNKRTAEEAFMAQPKTMSPFLPIFETFRSELDEHHDRRERIIKASRDITAASKKIIFSLQRVRTLNDPFPAQVAKDTKKHYDTIRDRYSSISRDLQGINSFRYQFQITPGNQEFVEAITFQHYLSHQMLMTHEEAQKELDKLTGGGERVILTAEDFLLGIFDMTGELMRFAITTMATTGQLPGAEKGPGHHTVLSDLRELRTQLEQVNVHEGGRFKKDFSSKMEVMRTCVEKVEGALYGQVVRGAERPKGWVPDLNGGRREEAEAY
ncbi:Translin [Trichodelitschia bisporula]|uniref:Translin n=1 Tax=Trichodelitschia bisporula TaxID=703511 RepID=A0A6G1I454_9PEZI|nr:Translin [Trichodelitschia bisporula]